MAQSDLTEARSTEAPDEDDGEFHYDAFISYRQQDPDRKVARWLQKSLEEFKTPPALSESSGYAPKINAIFLDTTDLAATPSLSEQLKKELKRSRYLIVICSPQSRDSAWINDEIREFSSLGRIDKILAVLIEGEPENAFPTALVATREAAGKDNTFAASDMPLAADLRPVTGTSQRIIKRTAVLRLAATLLGCEYDNLAQRAAERHRQWRNRIAAGAVFAALSMLSISLYALYQRSEAKNQSLLRTQAQKESRTNLAWAHFARGVESESSKHTPAAKILFAKSVQLYDSVETRKKLADSWNTSALMWKTDSTNAVVPEDDESSRSLRAIRIGHQSKHTFVGTGSGEVLVLDNLTGDHISSINIGRPITRLDRHPLDNRLAVGTADGYAMILNPMTGELGLQAKFPAAIQALAYNGDGAALAVGLEGAGMRVIDAENGQRWFRSISGTHETTVSGISFDPAGKEMIVAMGRWIYLADLSTNQFRVVTPQNDSILATAWSRSDNQILAWAGLDGPIQLHRRVADASGVPNELLTGRQREQPNYQELPGHPDGGITALRFIGDSDTLLSAGSNGDIRVWDTDNATLELVITGHAGAILDFSLSQDGKYLTTVGADNLIQLWQLDTGHQQQVWSVDDLPERDAYSERGGAYLADVLTIVDDQHLLIGLRDGTLLNRSIEPSAADAISNDNNQVIDDRDNTWLLSPDAQILGIITKPRWATAQFSEEATPGIKLFELPAMGETGALTIVDITHADWIDNETLVVGTQSGAIDLWDRESKRKTITLDDRPHPVVSIDISHSSETVAVAWSDGHVKVWRGSNHDLLFDQQVTPHPVNTVSLSPDGNSLILTTRGEVGRTALIDIRSGSIMSERAKWTRAVSFSQRDPWAALGYDTEGAIDIIDYTNGNPVVTLQGAERRIRALTFSHTGDKIFASDDAGTVQSWSLAHVETLTRLNGDDLLSQAVEQTGLSLIELDPVPTQPRQYTGSQKALPPTDLAVKFEPLTQLLSDIQQMSVDLYSDENTLSLSAETSRQIEQQVRDLISRASGLSVDANRVPTLQRAQTDLLLLLADLLAAQGKTDQSLPAYLSAIEFANNAWNAEKSRIWPTLFRSYDHYANALIASNQHEAAFAVISESMSILRELLHQQHRFAPPYSELWDRFNRAIRLLDGEKIVLALDLADENITFLSNTIAPNHQEPTVVEGVAMFIELGARIHLFVSQFDNAIEYLQIAESYQGSAVRQYLLSGGVNADNARDRWIDILNLLGESKLQKLALSNTSMKPSEQQQVLSEAKQHFEFAIDQLETLVNHEGNSSNIRTRAQAIYQNLEFINDLTDMLEQDLETQK